jgi:hypothetical protein
VAEAIATGYNLVVMSGAVSLLLFLRLFLWLFSLFLFLFLFLSVLPAFAL